MQYALFVADSLAANENHTWWLLIFVKSTRGSVAVYVVDSLTLVTVKVLTLPLHVKLCTFSLYYRILIHGDKTHPLIIFIVGTNNFIEYLQRYEIQIFISYKLYFIILLVIPCQYAVYVVGKLATI